MQIGVIEVPTLKELFVGKMEEQILTGRMKAGESLPSERQLQEETHISRSVIHAGLAELERKGFVEVSPRRGTVVANYEETGTMEVLNAKIRLNGGSMTEKQTHSFMEARIAIEGSALKKLAENHTAEDISCLEGLLSEADALLDGGNADPQKLSVILFNYHRSICVRSGNEFFPLLLNEFKPIIMEFWMSSVLRFGAVANVHLARRYLDFIRSGDAEGAYRRLVRSVNEYLDCTDKQ
ncbi:MAG: GntR family transcriptional regulator [Oscillospiraceae bacterium]|nr:GntR family transcriptional regulator [Oscillospiraceae bacterium]